MKQTPERDPGSETRNAAYYRAAARQHLRGRWKRALCVAFVIALLSGIIVGANINVVYSGNHIPDNADYRLARLTLGPLDRTVAFSLRDGKIVDSVTSVGRIGWRNAPPMEGLLPLAGAILGVLLILLLAQPVAQLAAARGGLRVMNDARVDFQVFRVTWRLYAKTIGALILAHLAAGWPSLLIMAAGAALSAACHTPILLSIAGFCAIAIHIPRVMLYLPALPYMLALYPEAKGWECVQRGAGVMRGRRWRLFCLCFSFLGWILLTALANSLLSYLGVTLALAVVLDLIGSLLTLPLLVYMSVALTAFLLDGIELPLSTEREVSGETGPAETESDGSPV